MQAAPVNPALPGHVFTRDSIQHLKYGFAEFWLRVESCVKYPLGIHQQINIGSRCVRLIQDEPKCLPPISVYPSHVGTKEGRGGALFLRIPRRSRRTKIALGD